MKKYVLGPNAARQLKKLLRGSGEVSRRGNLSSALAFGSEYANPYAVQWAQSANGGEGGWIIWLPGDALLVVDGQTVDVREDLEAVGGDYPDGWYLLGDVIEDNGTLNLDIHFPDPDAEDEDAPTEIYTTFSDGEDDEDEESSRTIHVAICDVATDAETGARSVQQFVTSMILMGDGGVTSLTGDDEESVSLDGDVLIDGHKCGLVVKTQIVEDENGKTKAVVYLDVKGRAEAQGCDNTDNWGCQPITLPGGGLAHYLGCRPLDLSNLGGGGGGGGGGDDPDGPDDPDNPPGGGGGVTSLNGEDGDLVLRLLEGWLEIVKSGQAVKAVGTVTTSVSGLIGDMAVIGGKKIRVDQVGNSLKISFDDGKESDDINPFPDGDDTCAHPDGGGGVSAGAGGGGGGVQGGGGESGGNSCCGGASAVGGSATGSPEPGVSGKPTTGGSGANGKEVTEAPSGGTSSGGKEAGGGLFGTSSAKKPIYTGTHTALTDTKKMNTSPFAKDPNWHGSIEETAANAKKPIYTGTHNALTDTKKMNESPFKRK